MERAVFPAQLELLVMHSAAQNGNVGFFVFLCFFKYASLVGSRASWKGFTLKLLFHSVCLLCALSH